ncbi:MAG: hypothetical protein F2536_01850 [Actinobacteria bacterium]|nr:hypothetical protein [Actinomycetota bacterium]
MSNWIQETMNVKKTLGLLLSLILAISAVSPAYANGVEPLLIPVADDEALFMFSEDEARGEWGSRIQLQPDAPDENLNRAPWIDCPTIDDPICDLKKPGYGGFAWIALPACESETAEDCVARFGIELNGELFPGEFVSAVNSGGTFPASPKFNLPRGGQSSIYKVPGAPHDQGDLYLVSPNGTANHERNGKFQTNDFYLNVIPVVIRPASYQETVRDTIPCIWRNTTECATRANFNPEAKVTVEMRVTNEVGGWFLGRMKDPTLSVEKFSNRNNTITVSAFPVQVARMAYKAKKKDVTLNDRIAAGNTGSIGEFDSQGPVRIINGGYDTSNFRMLSHFRDRVKDTAVGTSTIFQMRTTSRDSGNSCLSDRGRVLGIVSTNSMVYDGFAPRFSRGFLDYRVAGLHFEADGVTEVIGSYDLVMRSDVARCLYRFTNAPVSATISITGEGDKNIATTVVGEKNGWLKLAAYGFTFSQKIIKVKLTQKRTTITCVSNSSPVKTRKVTGMSPKCPTGFKKR